MTNFILSDIPNLLGKSFTFTDNSTKLFGFPPKEVTGLIEGVSVEIDIKSSCFFVNDNTYSFLDVDFADYPCQ